jgi:hypothetical protein
MSRDDSLFGIRFGSNEELYPSKEELEAFLESPKQDGALHGKDLERYQKLLADSLAFEKRKNQSTESIDYRERMYYAVLSHSCFLNQAVSASVEQYKYHVRSLGTLEFKKPKSFVRAAEEEIHGLDPKKREDAIRLTRLLDMTEERKSLIEQMTRVWMTVSEELLSIIVYLKDNLVKINRTCRMSLDILKDEALARNEEERLLGDIKLQFKEQLKDSLHRGAVTRQQIETVQHDVAILLKEMSALVVRDVEALKKLYEALSDHTGRAVSELDTLMTRYRNSPVREFETERDIFIKAENVLVSLVSGFHFDMYASVTRSATPYLNVLSEKRSEMLNHLLDLIRKDRRSVSDRRFASDRRKFRDPEYRGPERRGGKDRRSVSSRRKR